MRFLLFAVILCGCAQKPEPAPPLLLDRTPLQKGSTAIAAPENGQVFYVGPGYWPVPKGTYMLVVDDPNGTGPERKVHVRLAGVDTLPTITPAPEIISVWVPRSWVRPDPEPPARTAYAP
jgi:hypothetical protein